MSLAIAFFAQAAQPKYISDDRATLNVCRAGAVGCADSINVNGKKYLISYDQTSQTPRVQTLIRNMLGNCRLHGLEKSPAFAVEGYATLEKGHFPNTSAQFLVFKISMVANMAMPKGL